MDDIARRSVSERTDLFVTAASELGLNVAVVEKDFWVCWILKRLFSLPGFEGEFVFKGGTCLSKVYNAIERFSEDVDLVWNREFLGFGGDKDPLSQGVSQTKAEKELIPALMAAAETSLRERLIPALRASVGDALTGKARWDVELEKFGSQLTVVFHYPKQRGLASKYVRPYVLLEFVPRSEPVPNADATIRPYMFKVLGEAFKDPDVRVRHILVARTFWEKATILHMYHHYPEEKSFGERFARHYYDTFMLLRGGHFEEAVRDLELFRSVVRHKKRFYRSGPAKYDDALSGKLCLVPPDARMEGLRADYAAMEEMFFGKPPEFEDIIAALREIEAVVNRLTAPKPGGDNIEPPPPPGAHASTKRR